MPLFRTSYVTLIVLLSAQARLSAAEAFSDVTASSGIAFQHYNGATVAQDATPSRLMPETMGSGVAVFDYDNDGDLDLFFSNGQALSPAPENRTPTNSQRTKPSTPALYRNDGDWTFSDVTEQASLAISTYGMGVTIADINGDGLQDIVLAGLDGIRVFENSYTHQRWTFNEVTQTLGLQQKQWTNLRGQKGHYWATAAAVFDADGDKDLDILSIQYVKWSLESDIYTTFDGHNRGYSSPKMYPGTSMQLWLQNSGTFSDYTQTSGLTMEGKSLGIALWDFDKDGALDIVVANDTIENYLLKNQGLGRFKNVAVESQIAFDPHGNARAGMGIDIADYNNNGRAAIAIGNFSGEPTSFFRQHDTWHFSEDSEKVKIASATLPRLTFGLSFADINLDGWQDLVIANGHVEPGIASAFTQERYPQPLQYFENRQDGTFIDKGKDISALAMPMVGRGLATGDLDNDGDLDVVVTENNGTAKILRNNLANPRSLRVKLLGQAPNTNAIGAGITVKTNRGQQYRLVRTGGSYLSHSEFTQTFGFAKNEALIEITVQWPGGSISKYPLPIDNNFSTNPTLLNIAEPNHTVH